MIDRSFYIITENTGTVRVYSDEPSHRKFPGPTTYDRWMHRHLNDLDAKRRYESVVEQLLSAEVNAVEPVEAPSPAAKSFHPRIFPLIEMDAFDRFCAAIHKAPPLTAAKCKEFHPVA